jgi:hypothetical protein
MKKRITNEVIHLLREEDIVFSPMHEKYEVAFISHAHVVLMGERGKVSAIKMFESVLLIEEGWWWEEGS